MLPPSLCTAPLWGLGSVSLTRHRVPCCDQLCNSFYSSQRCVPAPTSVLCTSVGAGPYSTDLALTCSAIASGVTIFNSLYIPMYCQCTLYLLGYTVIIHTDTFSYISVCRHSAITDCCQGMSFRRSLNSEQH